MNSKIAAMEPHLDERIIQVIQEELSRLGVGSTKLPTHRHKSKHRDDKHINNSCY